MPYWLQRSVHVAGNGFLLSPSRRLISARLFGSVVYSSCRMRRKHVIQNRRRPVQITLTSHQDQRNLSTVKSRSSLDGKRR